MMPAVMIFGEVLVDVFPEQTIIGGAPYNVARHLHALGHDVCMVSAIGQDAYGERILHEMQSTGMNTQGVQTIGNLPTGQVQVSFTALEHEFEILDQQAYDAIDWAPMQQLLNAHPPQMAYIGTLSLRHAQTMQVAQQWLNQLSCPVFCDVNLRAPWFHAESLALVLRHADVLKINHEELPIVCELMAIAPNHSLALQAQALQMHFNISTILVTCGEDGSWCLHQEQLHHAPKVMLKTPFIDSVGAGDAYSAMMMRGLMAGWYLDACLLRAAEFATDICGVRGAVPVSKSFYQAYAS